MSVESTRKPFWPRRSPHFSRARTAIRHTMESLAEEYPEHSEGSVVIGVSGGPDSLILAAAAAAEGIMAEAISIDHQLQAESRAQAQRAIEQAARWGLPGTVVEVNIEPGNLEASARRARYQALFSVAGQQPVLVAHTLDDQAETLILSLLRGHASAMAAVSEDHGGVLVRPFLQLRRDDTVAACAELGVQPWHDPHNDNEDFRRVAVRKRLLPLLDEIHGGDARAPVAQAAGLIRADEDYLQHLARQHGNAHNTEYDDPVEPGRSIAIESLGAEPIARRKIRALAHEHGANITQASLNAIIALVYDWHGQGAVSLGDGLEVRRQAGRLVFT